MAKKSRAFWAWGLAIIVVGGAGFYFFSGDSDQSAGPQRGGPGGPGGFAPPPTLVTVAIVEEATISDHIESVGTLVANESVTITAQVTERVNKIHFDDGQYVEAGDILVELTSTEESAQLAEASINLDEAERQLNRLETLGSNVASAKLIDDARSSFNANKAKYDAVIARMEDRVVTAPFGGVLGFRQISLGSLVSPGTVITTLDDVSVVKLDFSVPEIYLNVLRMGNSVEAHSAAWPQRDFRGRVEAIGSRVDPVSRSVQVRAILPNEDRVLRPGMLMTVELTGLERTAIVIPEAALVQTGSSSYVYVVDEESKPMRREVFVSERRVGQVVIASGISVGERIIVDGVSMVVPGRAVRVVNSEAEGPGRS
jgi:membrane fusion protein (multidrug efflux system)